MALGEEASNSEFDGHDDLVQTISRPGRPPKNVSKATVKYLKASNFNRKGWGSRLFSRILEVD